MPEVFESGDCQAPGGNSGPALELAGLTPDVEKHLADEVFRRLLVPHEPEPEPVHPDMVPPVQHLHGEPVTLGDPGDQDLVRSRLCHAQSPSRKIGRVDAGDGSTGGVKFFNLPQSYGDLCDLPHIRAISLSRPWRSALWLQDGNIIQKHSLADEAVGWCGWLGRAALSHGPV